MKFVRLNLDLSQNNAVKDSGEGKVGRWGGELVPEGKQSQNAHPRDKNMDRIEMPSHLTSKQDPLHHLELIANKHRAI